MGRLKVTSFDTDIVDHPIKSKYYTIKHRLKPLQRMRKYMLIFNELELLTNSDIINKESKMFDAYVMFILNKSKRPYP
jgi:hypothetical protein